MIFVTGGEFDIADYSCIALQIESRHAELRYGEGRVDVVRFFVVDKKTFCRLLRVVVGPSVGSLAASHWEV